MGEGIKHSQVYMQITIYHIIIIVIIIIVNKTIISLCLTFLTNGFLIYPM